MEVVAGLELEPRRTGSVVWHMSRAGPMYVHFITFICPSITQVHN